MPNKLKKKLKPFLVSLHQSKKTGETIEIVGDWASHSQEKSSKAIRNLKLPRTKWKWKPTYQNLWDTATTVPRRKFLPMST